MKIHFVQFVCLTRSIVSIELYTNLTYFIHAETVKCCLLPTLIFQTTIVAVSFLILNPAWFKRRHTFVLLGWWNAKKSKYGLRLSVPAVLWLRQATFSGWSSHTLPPAMHHRGEGPWKIMCLKPLKEGMCVVQLRLATMCSTQVPSWQPRHVATLALEKSSVSEAKGMWDEHAREITPQQHDVVTKHGHLRE